MRRTYRAAALAVAAFSLGAAASFTPSAAAEGMIAPATSFAEHVAAGIAVADLGLDSIQSNIQLTDQQEVSAPLVTHAVAQPAPTPLPLPPVEAVEEEAPRANLSLAELVREYASSETSDEETECLARAVYWESKGEPLSGQLTVAEVIINRANSGRFRDTICGVVRQPSQFSFVRRGHIPAPPKSSQQWRTAVAIAEIAREDLAEGAAPRALFFHARHVSPRWRGVTRVATVGNHVFYR